LCKPETVKVAPPKEQTPEPKKINSPISSEPNRRNSLISLDDFVLLGVLGEGGYGKVYLVKKKDNSRQYALKKVRKELFKSTLRLKDATNEKNIMARSSHPFIVKLYFCFQDKSSLYYCMEYVEGGVLFRYIREQRHLSENVTKFYIAQVVLALKYLHEEIKIIYRDLKPENLLLDNMGYLKVTDFGLSTRELTSRRGDNNERVWNVRVHSAGDHRRRTLFEISRLLESGKLTREF